LFATTPLLLLAVELSGGRTSGALLPLAHVDLSALGAPGASGFSTCCLLLISSMTFASSNPLWPHWRSFSGLPAAALAFATPPSFALTYEEGPLALERQSRLSSVSFAAAGTGAAEMLTIASASWGGISSGKFLTKTSGALRNIGFIFIMNTLVYLIFSLSGLTTSSSCASA